MLVTGATGFIGSQVVDLLLSQGQHEVTGLARNEERAKLLAAKGVKPLVADLRSADVVAGVAAQADAVVRPQTSCKGKSWCGSVCASQHG